MTGGSPKFKLRLASIDDVPQLARLIDCSVRKLHPQFYSPALIEASLGPMFGVDRQLILDGTYYVIEAGEQLLACGGWSRRLTMCGSDQGRKELARELDPATEAARIRAYFVHPEFARKGLATRILKASEEGLLKAGFKRAEISATLMGAPLYVKHGYRVRREYTLPLPGGLELPVVGLDKDFVL